MQRPVDLPDFKMPPLNEVVFGIQFQPPVGYSQIHAGEVWQLFKSDFPVVQELPPLPPQFETFGLPATPSFNFGIFNPAQHNRFWFLSPDHTQLIQFQADRLLHNWRKIKGQLSEYPRFETMFDSFEAETRNFETYVGTLNPQTLHCHQVEISYVNHIKLDHENAGKAAS